MHGSVVVLVLLFLGKLERNRHVVFLRRNYDDSADDSGHVSDRDHWSNVKRCLGDLNDLEIRSC